jgi:aldose 1-epimerase
MISTPGITSEPWGRLSDGPAVRRFTIRNARDMRVVISDLGATLLSWYAPERSGRVADILLGHDSPDEYLHQTAYLGATVGRWANRIAQARFTLDGITYNVDCNEGPNLLHGGFSGFNRAVWEVAQDDGALVLTHRSPEGEGGFPGNLSVSVRYRLADDGTLSIDYDALTDAPTPVNLTNHAYFNLGGARDVCGHIMTLHSDAYLAVDDGFIPTGRVDVAGKAFDFREAAPIGARLAWPDQQLAREGGFDHCYVLREPGSAPAMREAAVVYDPASGRELSVATTECGLQFYTGNFLAGTPGRNGETYAKHAGLCLEAAGFPNQVNMPEAEAAILRPGARYRQTTLYRMKVREGT